MNGAVLRGIMEGTTMQGTHFGLTGLGVMGQNLARNVARHGFPIVVHNRTRARTDEFLNEYGVEGHIIGASDVVSFVGALQPPRAILIMVKAGPPIDEVIGQLTPHLDRGDVLIDGGNSFHMDTQRRLQALATDGILYLGTGISGGEEGALHGPSIMPGGSRAAYEIVAPIFMRIAAQVDGTPCCTYIGDGGAGHYVKMVHNGIEYADMQLIAEAYDLLKSAVGLNNDDLAQTFQEWNQGDLDSFLIQITAQIFQTKDPDTGDYLVDRILDTAEQKGTGKWTSQSALDLGVPVTAIPPSKTSTGGRPGFSRGRAVVSRAIRVPLSTPSGRRCTPRRWWPMRRGLNKCWRRGRSTVGTCTPATSPASGAVAASSAPAS